MDTQDAEAAVIDAAFGFLRWADGEATDLTGLPAPALALLDQVEQLSQLYDPHRSA